MSIPRHHAATDQELAFWACWLDEIGDDKIRKIDRIEARFDDDLVRRCGLSSLTRREQAEVMRALELHLYPTKRIAKHAPSSYALKHAAEDYVGFYVSDLQARTVMRLLGYKSTVMDYYPRYNVSLVAWRKFKERSRDLDRERQHARRVEKATCDYFFTMGMLARERYEREHAV